MTPRRGTSSSGTAAAASNSSFVGIHVLRMSTPSAPNSETSSSSRTASATNAQPPRLKPSVLLNLEIAMPNGCARFESMNMIVFGFAGAAAASPSPAASPPAPRRATSFSVKRLLRSGKSARSSVTSVRRLPQTVPRVSARASQ